MNELIIKLPPKFALDHTERDCSTGAAIRETKAGITYRITDRTTFEDWLSDADYYADPTEWDSDFANLCASAKRALDTLRTHVADACDAWGHEFTATDGHTFCRYCNEPLVGEVSV